MSQILPGSIFLPRNVIVCSDLTLTVKEKKSQILIISHVSALANKFH